MSKHLTDVSQVTGSPRWDVYHHHKDVRRLCAIITKMSGAKLLTDETLTSMAPHLIGDGYSISFYLSLCILFVISFYLFV